MKSSLWLAAACALVVAAGCSGMKVPAAQAVASAESSLAVIRGDAAKYAPAALHSVEAQIASLKDNLAKADYKAVMGSVPNVTRAIRDLGNTVRANKRR